VSRGSGNSTSPNAADRERALALIPVSRETEARLDRYAALLRRWQAVKNLVGPGTLTELWTRHFADSLQLVDYAPPRGRAWVDLGSGAGLPGLVIAIAGSENGHHVTLIEANSRKCAFLRAAIRETGAVATIKEGRIETVLSTLDDPVELVTARALAPFARLLAWSDPLLKRGAVGLFLKGREVERELTEAAKSWRFDAELLPSRTDSAGRIVRVQAAERR
jgi:16S rRNA (guanine527-N7)-methyltransferase